MKDIAKASGVSTATVSYVVNNGPRSVLPETRDRILTVMNQLGYHPNAAARSLMGKRTQTFGIVLPHVGIEPVNNQYFSTVLSGIIDVASERKQVTMLFTGMTWEEVVQNVPQFSDGRCDGFVFLAPPAGSRFPVELGHRKKPVVLVGTRAEGLLVNTVDCENVKGARLAVRHLVELGHQRIAFITGDVRSTSSPERFEGYQRELKGAAISFNRDWVIKGGYSANEATEAAKSMIALHKDAGITAVVCAHDSIAEVVYHAAAQAGVCIPKDLSVTGFDDLPFTAGMQPSLTTVHQPLRQIGATAARTLLDLIDDSNVEPHERLFDVHLVVRCSTAAPPATN